MIITDQTLTKYSFSELYIYIVKCLNGSNEVDAELLQDRQKLNVCQRARFNSIGKLEN